LVLCRLGLCLGQFECICIRCSPFFTYVSAPYRPRCHQISNQHKTRDEDHRAASHLEILNSPRAPGRNCGTSVQGKVVRAGPAEEWWVEVYEIELGFVVATGGERGATPPLHNTRECSLRRRYTTVLQGGHNSTKPLHRKKTLLKRCCCGADQPQAQPTSPTTAVYPT